MNYLTALLGIALLGAITTTAIFRADAADYKSQLVTLEASYAQTTQKAKDDAAAQIAADKAENQRRADSAISQALQGQKTAQEQLKNYQAKLKADAGMKDLGHVCSGVEIPKDLIP